MPIASRWIWVLLIWGAVLPACPAQFSFQPPPTGSVPEGARVTLESDRTNYFLGENILIHFILENTSQEPFSASFGGDYRGSSRALRFLVSAVDESGHEAEDPDPHPICFGGLMGSQTLKPGQKYLQSLALMRYRKLLHPGRYSISIAHDFGWQETDARKRPVGKIVLSLQMPDAAQAEEVVSRMEKLPENPTNIVGEKFNAYGDFRCLCQPVYLDPLLRRVRAGNSRALAGISAIANTNATAVMIDLAGGADSQLALDAARGLIPLLPFAGTKPESLGSGPFRFDIPEFRNPLRQIGWNPGFAPQVKSLAGKFLKRNDSAAISVGAFMVQALGTVDQAPEVFAALDRVLSPMVSPRHDAKDNILNFPEPIPELLRAVDALHQRGLELNSGGLSGNAQIMVWFHWLENTPGPRPARWLEMAEAFGDGNRYPLNETVVRSIPLPLADDCVPLVQRAMKNRDYGVCRAACEIAGHSGRAEFIAPLLAIAATEPHDWLLRSVGVALQELKAGFEAWEVWADRLADETIYPIALDQLQLVFENVPGSYTGRTDLSREERLELRRQWQKFLAAHEAELRAGNKFLLKEAPPELFGKARTF